MKDTNLQNKQLKGILKNDKPKKDVIEKRNNESNTYTKYFPDGTPPDNSSKKVIKARNDLSNLITVKYYDIIFRKNKKIQKYD